MATMLVTVPLLMAMVTLMEEEGEHTQETELGVHLYSHCLLNSGLLPTQEGETNTFCLINDEYGAIYSFKHMQCIYEE